MSNTKMTFLPLLRNLHTVTSKLEQWSEATHLVADQTVEMTDSDEREMTTDLIDLQVIEMTAEAMVVENHPAESDIKSLVP